VVVTKARYKFRIDFDDFYHRPKIYALQTVHHPNFPEAEDEVCVDYDWEPGMSLETIIAVLFWLIENPNFDDPLKSVDADEYEDVVEDIVKTLKEDYSDSEN